MGLKCASSSKGRQENAGVGWREDEWARMGEINPTISQYRDQEGCAGHTYCTFISASNRILRAEGRGRMHNLQVFQNTLTRKIKALKYKSLLVKTMNHNQIT
jgi:hypothetical protein